MQRALYFLTQLYGVFLPSLISQVFINDVPGQEWPLQPSEPSRDSPARHCTSLKKRHMLIESMMYL